MGHWASPELCVLIGTWMVSAQKGRNLIMLVMNPALVQAHSRCSVNSCSFLPAHRPLHTRKVPPYLTNSLLNEYEPLGDQHLILSLFALRIHQGQPYNSTSEFTRMKHMSPRIVPEGLRKLTLGSGMG